MSALVVDASVAAKWYLPEEDSGTALAVLGSGRVLHAPDLLRLEFASAFWKHVRLRHIDQEVWPLARPRLERSIQQWHDSGACLAEAFELACAMDHPIYDCIYLALARRLDARLITADRRLLARLTGSAHSDLVMALPDFKHDV